MIITLIVLAVLKTQVCFTDVNKQLAALENINNSDFVVVCYGPCKKKEKKNHFWSHILLESLLEYNCGEVGDTFVYIWIMNCSFKALCYTIT